MRISKELEYALKYKKPVVALESTIISHGMPYPKNFETAIEIEKTIRESDVIPATIGVINGEVVVGLSNEEIKFLSKAKGVMKLSTREIPLCVAKKMNGATTVSATSFIAEKIGIKVFATGGIGGVHRGAAETFDISRDLEELSFLDIIVVSAGAKSILDLPKTIEYLETKGILVLGYKTDEFPSFYSRKSGIKIPKVNSVDEIASIFIQKIKHRIKGSILIANPIPIEDEIPFEEEEFFVKEAIKEARKNNISGKALTPFILSKLSEISQGKTLKANISLVMNNAKIASKIAISLKENGLD